MRRDRLDSAIRAYIRERNAAEPAAWQRYKPRVIASAWEQAGLPETSDTSRRRLDRACAIALNGLIPVSERSERKALALLERKNLSPTPRSIHSLAEAMGRRERQGDTVATPPPTPAPCQGEARGRAKRSAPGRSHGSRRGASSRSSGGGSSGDDSESDEPRNGRLHNAEQAVV